MRLVLAVALLLAGCSSGSDEVSSEQLRGVWASQGDKARLVLSLASGGQITVESATQEYAPVSGEWRVEKGRFRGVITSSHAGVLPAGHSWDDEIISVTNTDLVLRNSANQIEVFVRPADTALGANIGGPGTERWRGRGSGFAAGVSPDELVGPCDVTRVVDGDTVYVQCGDVFAKVRLLNIDTAERGEQGHEEALQAMVRLIGDEPVYLAFETPGEPSYGKYNRLLAYLYNEQGENLNLEMVRWGWSGFYTKYGEGRFHEEFRAAELQAIGR